MEPAGELKKLKMLMQAEKSIGHWPRLPEIWKIYPGTGITHKNIEYNINTNVITLTLQKQKQAHSCNLL